ncbi:MAG: hypothetical protein ABWY30_05475 [Microterricola sp.]
MGIVILLPLAALMIALLALSVRRRRRIAAGLPVRVAMSDRIAALRARYRAR